MVSGGQVARNRRQAPAGGNHGVFAAGQLGDYPLLQLAERRFALLRENLGNRPPRAGLDDTVGIQERKAQRLGGQTADGRLPRSHKAGQGEISNGAACDHA